MNRLIMPGSVALLMTFVVGLWMVISPFVMKAQAAGATWSTATINNVAVGGLLTIVALCGFCITLGLGLRDLIHAAGQRSEQAPGEPVTAQWLMISDWWLVTGRFTNHQSLATNHFPKVRPLHD